MDREKPSHKTSKRKPGRVAASYGVGLASLFLIIIILILLVAPIASMGVVALTCIFTVPAREAQL
jgi:uncharacterized membrane protein